MKKSFVFCSLLVAVLVVVALMFACYKSWSVYGYYGWMSFTYSAVFCVPWGIFVFAVINHFHKKED